MTNKLEKDASTSPLDAMEALLARQRDAPRRPLHLWSPPERPDIGLAIEADGRWTYQSSPIDRLALAQLFASVLMRDADGAHWLVTPGEKVPIRVVDAPFHIVEMIVRGRDREQQLLFRNTLDDVVVAGADARIRFAGDPTAQDLAIYVDMRDGLEGRLARAVAYDFLDLAVEGETATGSALGVWSGGEFFPIVSSDLLEAALGALGALGDDGAIDTDAEKNA